MVIAVTGASGHVGINLCKALLAKGHEVRALYHKNDSVLRTVTVSMVQGDVLDRDSLRPLLAGADVVFHLAARISITGDPDGMVHRINAEGTRNMIAVARECKVGRFVHFSSIHAFCQAPYDKPLDETRPIVVKEGFAYDRSKAEGERAVMEAAAQGFHALVVSPTAILGPDDPEPSLTGKAVIDICNRKIPSLVPGGYDWVDVRDVVAGAIAASEQGRAGEKYLLSGHWHDLKEFSSVIGRCAGTKTVSTVVPIWLARVGLPFITLCSRLSGREPLYTGESLTILSEGNRMISNAKARRELGFNPRPLTETIGDLISWFRTNKYLDNTK